MSSPDDRRKHLNIAETLDAVNKRFYAHHAEGFNETRQHPWSGWDRVLPHIEQNGLTRIVDVGCGNGRFARFLANALTPTSPSFSYFGYDREAQLLARATKMNLPFKCHWQAWNWMEGNAMLTLEKSDLTVPFGVLHHIYGFQNRVQFLRDLGDTLQIGGTLVVSTWNFGSNPRYASKYLDQSTICNEHGIDPGALEANDYFLGFGHQSPLPRYCHWVSDAEMQQIESELKVSHPNLQPRPPIQESADLNRYWIWRQL